MTDDDYLHREIIAIYARHQITIVRIRKIIQLEHLERAAFTKLEPSSSGKLNRIELVTQSSRFTRTKRCYEFTIE